MTITINGSGTVTGASTLATTVASPTFTTPNIDSAQFATVSGTAPIYPCRAWVNFNGTGTVAIRGSGNVSSITDNGVGDYTVNFTTAMPDANYGINLGSGPSSGVSPNFYNIYNGTTPLTTSIRVQSQNYLASAFLDVPYYCVSIFR